MQLLLGNNLDLIKDIQDNSIDAIVTDPPYGLGKEPDALPMLAAWLSSGHYDYSSNSGFMGKTWDAFVPQPLFWKECLRVLKPGGHILTFGGTRTYDLVTLGLRIAGFEIRDVLQWVYGSGFPKSLDIGKAIGKVNESGWQGYGTALKPAYESIVVAQKPIEVGSDIGKYFVSLLEILKTELCQYQSFVKIAEKHLKLNQQEQSEVLNIAQLIVGKNTNIQDDLSVLMAILQSGLETHSNWNTVLLWLNTLDDLYEVMSTSTTEMEIGLIIELKTLNLLEWGSIFQSIIQVNDNQESGLSANVYIAETLFSALRLKLKAIQILSVIDDATLQENRKTFAPNIEPIIMARKPLDGTVAPNVLKYGTEEDTRRNARGGDNGLIGSDTFKIRERFASDKEQPSGRFPANLIHDGSEEVLQRFPNATIATKPILSPYNQRKP